MTRPTALVTGGAGMIGSNLVRRLCAEGYQVKVVDNLWRGRVENLRDDDGRELIDLDKDFVQADLSVAGGWEHLLAADVVYHLADVVGGISFVFQNQGFVFRKNILINSNVIEAARQHKPGAFVYVDTACSFPAEKQRELDGPPLREEDLFPANPESAYGWSKLMGQYEARLLGDEGHTPTALLVLHNVYGSPCEFEGSRAQVIPALIRKALRHPEEPFVVWGSGNQARAFVHVDDVVAALVEAPRVALGKGPIQIGPDSCTTIREIAERVVAISGKQIPISFDETRPEGDRARRADFTKARETLRWKPEVSLDVGLRRLYRWIEDRLSGRIR